MALTRKIFALHHWMGLIAGSFILVFFLTGAVIVFREELNTWENPHLFTVTPQDNHLPYDEIYRKVQAQVPDVYLYSFRHLPQTPEETIEMRVFRNGEYPLLYVNPYTAQVLGIENNSWYDILIHLHYTFYLKTTGELLAGIFALALIGSVLTGLFVYRKYLLKVLLFQVAMNWKNWRTISSGLHRILGVWSLLFNLVLAISGFCMMWYAFHPSYHISAVTPEKISLPPPIHANLDSLMQQTKTIIPGIHINYVNFPRNPGETVSVMGDLPGDWLWGETASYVEYNPDSGKAEKIFREANLSAGEKIEYALYTLHYGQYGGKTIKFIYSLFGLTGAIITICGFLLWWRRTSPSGKKKTSSSKKSRKYAVAGSVKR